MSRITRGDLDITYHTLKQLAKNDRRTNDKCLDASILNWSKDIVKVKLDKAMKRLNKR